MQKKIDHSIIQVQSQTDSQQIQQQPSAQQQPVQIQLPAIQPNFNNFQTKPYSIDNALYLQPNATLFTSNNVRQFQGAPLPVLPNPIN